MKNSRFSIAIPVYWVTPSKPAGAFQVSRAKLAVSTECTARCELQPGRKSLGAAAAGPVEMASDRKSSLFILVIVNHYSPL